jgi:hypothetical protein
MADEADLQLAFLPLLLEATDDARADSSDLDLVRRLLERAGAGLDPKVEALACSPPTRRRRSSSPTRQRRAAPPPRWPTRSRSARSPDGGVAGRDRVPTRSARSLRSARSWRQPPHASAAVDVLIATDLLGEGLNLQDAKRVIHYDLPWSPRLAQRVGRIDRLASPHGHVTTATFLPPEPLASALDVERRLALKVKAQLTAGAAEVETVRGRTNAEAPLDWCDRLQHLAAAGASRTGCGGATVAATAMHTSSWSDWETWSKRSLWNGASPRRAPRVPRCCWRSGRWDDCHSVPARSTGAPPCRTVHSRSTRGYRGRALARRRSRPRGSAPHPLGAGGGGVRPRRRRPAAGPARRLVARLAGA